MSRKGILFLAILTLTVSAQTAETLTNNTIFKMVQSGAPSSVIIQTIAAAPRVDFGFLPGDLQAFTYYKVPDDVFKAMAAKDHGRPIPGLQTQAPVQVSVKPTPGAQPTASSVATLPNRGHFALGLGRITSVLSGAFKEMAAFGSKAYLNPYSLPPATPTSLGYAPLPTFTLSTPPQPSGGTATRLGNYNYYTFDNGVTGTSNRIGNFTYYNFSDGLDGTSNRIGNFTYQNWSNGVTGSGNRIGNFNYYNWSDGSSATQNRIGNFTYTNFNDGKTCTTQKIGTYSYTNCN